LPPSDEEAVAGGDGLEELSEEEEEEEAVAGGDGLEVSSGVEESSSEEGSVVGSTSEVSSEAEEEGAGGVGGKAVPETLVSSPAIVADTVGVALASPSTVTVGVAFPLVSVLVELRQVHVSTSGVCPKGHVPSSPNGTNANFGPPNTPGSTPSNCLLTTPLNSSDLGALVQYGVEGTIPRMFKAFRGCCRYLIANAMREAWVERGDDFANEIMRSAMSCWAQGSASANKASKPPNPAKVTQGDESEGSVVLEEEGEVVLAEKLLEKIGPPEERHRSCHCCAMFGRSACAILFPNPWRRREKVRALET